MGPKYKTPRGILLFSAVLLALLFWLSTSFLMVAHTEKRDADFLKHHIATDTVLRQVSIVLAEERSSAYWLAGLNGLFDVPQTLARDRSVTDTVLQEFFRQYNEVMALPRYGDRLKFRRSHIERLMEKTRAEVLALADHRAKIERELGLPLNRRDKNLELEILDFYRSLAEQFELLRYATTYVLSQQVRGTQNLLAISDAAWNIKFANQLLTALFEGYLTSGNVARGDAIIRANTQVSHLRENLAAIRMSDSFANMDEDLNEVSAELVDWFGNAYEEPVNDISVAMAENVSANYSNYEWKQLFRQMGEHADAVLERAEIVTGQRVTSASERATRNLIIDILLVLFSVVLVFVAYWIIRRVHHQATHDVLTNLPNRRFFVSSCEQRVSSDENAKTTLMKIDLSKFKSINDSFGQTAGDKLLQEVAGQLRQVCADNRLIARLGSDEFAVLLENADRAVARRAASDISDALSGQFLVDGQSMNLKTCVGYACFPRDASCSEGLVKAADLALYEAKQTGAGTITGFETSIAERFHERQLLETDLARALGKGEFELHYQPQFDIGRQVVDGVEALIRWRHPERGLVSPFHFIPVAEEAGLLPAIGEWVINEAVRQSAVWQEQGLYLRVSVNVSAHQFLEGDVVNIIQNALEREKLAPESFEIEITESVAMVDLESVVEKLGKLQEAGIRIALDDFGTGYSSLSYLQDLPLDTLKIDRSFVTKLDNGTRSQKLLIESIASMAKQLELHTVAEGVETDSQLRQVCALGIDTVQGYYYSKPVSAGDIPGDVKAIDAAHALDKAA